jgi:hypothetical protein|tara:strand:+ start:325 stop:573 length:249 start_codon:yes stop_codon:yes gene_type:complete
MTTINITLMNTPNFFLEKKRHDQTSEGRAVRKELQRRKQVDFYISCDEEKAELEAELEEAKLKAIAQEESVEVTYAVGVKKI